jgi:hypothetical protein
MIYRKIKIKKAQKEEFINQELNCIPFVNYEVVEKVLYQIS